MARYILLEVDDNGEADELVKAVGVAGAVFFMGEDGHFKNADPSNVSVRAVFGKPTKFCDCTPNSQQARGKKWGWMVHTKCGKPILNRWQHPRNLLSEDDESVAGRRDIYLGVVEPRPEEPVTIPPGQGPQPPKPIEDPEVNYDELPIAPREKDNKRGWGECQNVHCKRWYLSDTGYWYNGASRAWGVCSRPCAKVLHDEGR